MVAGTSASHDEHGFSAKMGILVYADYMGFFLVVAPKDELPALE